MMYRYVALSWDSRNPDAGRVAAFIMAELPRVSPHEWETAYQAAGLVVMHAGEHKGRMQTYRLAGGNGVILGRLFRNASDGTYASQVDDLGDAETRRCLESKTQHLIDNYWGRYVTFLHERATDTRLIMRDPSGAFPCFVTQFKGVEIYFSDMQDAADLEFLPFTVNWDFVRANIMLPMYQKTITGLNEVGEVLPAECVEITPAGRNSRFVWDPTEIAATSVVEDVEEAATILRTVVRNTIQALSGCYDRIIHNLGGLDSSIALACMVDAPTKPDITCVTHFTNTPRGDERFYSRQMASHADVPLVEAELDARKADLSRIFQSNKLAKPHGFFDCLGLNGHVLEAAKARNAQVLFYGVGGDQVFYQPPFNLSALDYVHYHGFGKGWPRIALEASRYGRKKIATTCRSMLRERLFPEPCFHYIHELLFGSLPLPLVDLALVNSSGFEKYLHPLLRPTDAMAKGKYLHILMSALFSIDHYDHWDTSYSAERIHLFLSQPIIEACLRIPTWVLTYNGIERGLARKAFKYDLPRDIVTRISKNGPDDYYLDIFKLNIDTIRETLIDGDLTSHSILNNEALLTSLNHIDHHSHFHPAQFLAYYATEAWIKCWKDRRLTRMKHNDATSVPSRCIEGSLL